MSLADVINRHTDNNDFNIAVNSHIDKSQKTGYRQSYYQSYRLHHYQVLKKAQDKFRKRHRNELNKKKREKYHNDKNYRLRKLQERKKYYYNHKY